jgi:hypothetical protein
MVAMVSFEAAGSTELPITQVQGFKFPSTAPKSSDPSHPDLIQVHRGLSFGSGAFSLVDLPAGALFTRITTHTTDTPCRYSSVQTSRNNHIELNSDLLYCNHSCKPSVDFVMAKMEVRVVADRPLRAGDALTFFYPTTEWEMDQPFVCKCGEKECKKQIRGAKFMARDDLKGYRLNVHIEELLRERDGL